MSISSSANILVHQSKSCEKGDFKLGGPLARLIPVLKNGEPARILDIYISVRSGVPFVLLLQAQCNVAYIVNI